MKVFQTLTKIVMGFSFVAIAFTLVVGSVSLMADKLPFELFHLVLSPFICPHPHNIIINIR